MKNSDFSFEEAKLRIASGLKKLKDLDDIRRKLNEQLFLLDLQQEVSIKRYKKYLQMIGEYQQQENNRYIYLQNKDENNLLSSLNGFISSINKDIPIICSQKIKEDRITNVKAKLEQYKIFIFQKKEAYLNLTKQDMLITSILNQKDCANDELKWKSNISNSKKNDAKISESISNCMELEILMNKINDQLNKKNKLVMRREGLFRELKIMFKIEKELQNQLFILQKQADILVEKRKWHPESLGPVESSKDSKFTICKSSLSIP
ncbi:hypothetical protein M9Y10_025700 [Tritrichomonas musculus]|uniref:DUF4201 domain-containing protein n=1 Tax=Tritrichomonas musculus TaxID=1915356 RepID=A0ABR2H9F6_9EUKA